MSDVLKLFEEQGHLYFSSLYSEKITFIFHLCIHNICFNGTFCLVRMWRGKLQICPQLAREIAATAKWRTICYWHFLGEKILFYYFHPVCVVTKQSGQQLHDSALMH